MRRQCWLTGTWTRPATLYFLYPTRFSFEKYQVAGNPKYGVLPHLYISLKISNIRWNTRIYPRVKKMPENTPSFFSTLLRNPNPTRYPVFFPILTWPGPIVKNFTLWAQKIKRNRIREGFFYPFPYVFVTLSQGTLAYILVKVFFVALLFCCLAVNVDYKPLFLYR